MIVFCVLLLQLGTDTSKQKEKFYVYIATVQDEFAIGHGAILLCKILKTKAPTTAAEWIREKDNKTLKTQIFYEKLSKDSKSEHFEFTLKISEVSDNDDGLYICRANSSIGSDQDSYFLNVTGKFCRRLLTANSISFIKFNLLDADVTVRTRNALLLLIKGRLKGVLRFAFTHL